jgi:hypothetical protein
MRSDLGWKRSLLLGTSTIQSFKSAHPDSSMEQPHVCCALGYQYFLTDVDPAFAVDGSTLPNITWDVGESYAGLLPINQDPNETRKLFFWFFPSYDPTPRDEIVVWRK